MNFKEFRLLSEATKDLYSAIGKESTDKLLSTPVDPKVQTMHDSVFGAGKNHIEMPLENDVPSKVKEHIESNGDKLDGENVTLKTGRSAPISKYLAKSKAPKDVQDEHENWSRNKVANSKLVITRNPGEVASASTNTHWSSCARATTHQRDNTPAWNAMPHEVTHGTLMAMHVHKDAVPNEHGEYDSEAVLGRALIKKHADSTGGDVSFHREGRSYGAFPESAKKAVDEFTAKSYPQKSMVATKEKTLYNDDASSVKVNANHEDIAHAYTKSHPKALSQADQESSVYSSTSPQNVFDNAAKSEHKTVLNSVAKNSTNPKTIREVYDNPNSGRGKGFYFPQMHAIKNPHAPQDILNSAQDHEDDSVRAAVASHPNATAAHLTKAIDDKDDYVRRDAVENPNLTSHHIDKILNGSDKTLKIMAVRHNNVSNENLHKAFNDESSDVVQSARSSPKIKHEHIEAALNSSNVETRASVARHRLMTTDDIHTALRDKSPIVRKAAIENLNSNRAHVDSAIKDAASAVRLSAVMNKSAQKEHFEIGAKDSDEIVSTIAQHRLDKLE